MKEKLSYSVCPLILLGTAGNFLITVPLSSDDGSDLLGLLLSILSSFIVIALLLPLGRAVYNDTEEKNTAVKILKAALYVLTIGLLIIIALGTAMDFCRYGGEVVLPGVSSAGLFFVPTGLALFLISRGKKTLFKTAFVISVAVIALSLLVFVFSISKMSLKYIIPRGFPDIKTSAMSGIRIFLKSFGEVLIPISVIASHSRTKNIMVGNLLGGGLIAVTVLNTLLVFGGGFASTLKYPYSSAVSTVNLGDIFSRMDGFVYLLIFFACLLKIAFLFFSVYLLGKRLFSLKKN